MMGNRTIRVIGAAMGRGAGDANCRKGPEALRRHGLVQRLSADGLDVAWEATLRARPDGDAVAAVRDLSTRLARRVQFDA